MVAACAATDAVDGTPYGSPQGVAAAVGHLFVLGGHQGDAEPRVVVTGSGRSRGGRGDGAAAVARHSIGPVVRLRFLRRRAFRKINCLNDYSEWDCSRDTALASTRAHKIRSDSSRCATV